MSVVLDVYLHQQKVGQLFMKSRDMHFCYDEAYLNSVGAMPISVALPLQSHLFDDGPTRPFFSGLLPDEDLKRRVAKYLHISAKNNIGMLEAIGRECAGAISFYPQGERPITCEQHIKYLSQQQLADMLILLRRRPLLVGEDDVCLSLAGAQDKVAVVFKGDKLGLAQGGMPTSHILKPEIRDLRDSVENEFFCMRLAGKVGIDVPNIQMMTCDDNTFLLIERYDRILDSKKQLRRLHQEDFCQALSVLPEYKYENEGGPGIADCIALIKSHSSRPAVDLREFMRRVVFNYLIGNADAHAKNFSFLYKDGATRLTPAYDLLSTTIYPGLTDKMAMKIGGKYRPELICKRHWYKLVEDTQTAARAMDSILQEMSQSIVTKAEQLQQELKLDISPIIALIQKRASRLSK